VNGPDRIVDLHVHSGPSILPRRSDDPETVRLAVTAGVEWLVLKAHEGSTAERARLAGAQVVGGIVLNSTVGGANPDAVAVAAALGARVVWLPTVSAVAHQAAVAGDAALAVHRQVDFRTVPMWSDGVLADDWHDVLDVVAEHDLVLGSGHIPILEVIDIFRVAAARGVRRFVINHPFFSFMGWNRDVAAPLVSLAVRLEVGCVADLETDATRRLVDEYDPSLLVFGSDLGHTAFPAYVEGVQSWIERLLPIVGEDVLTRIMSSNGRDLLLP
jgi:hypothetical protein